MYGRRAEELMVIVPAIKNVAWRRTHCRETGTDQQAKQATGRLLESGDFEAMRAESDHTNVSDNQREIAQ